MEDSPNKENELINLMRQAKDQGQKITNESREKIEDGQYIVDLANEGLNVTKYGISPNISLDHNINAWKYVVSQQGEILKSYNAMPTVTSGTAVAYTMTNLTNPNNVMPFVPTEKQNEVKMHVQHLSEVIDRQADRGKVLALLGTFNLNIPEKGLKSPR